MGAWAAADARQGPCRPIAGRRHRTPPSTEVLLEATTPSLPRLRRLVRLLDEAVGIPGTRVRVGLDALLGLLPVGGDVVGAVLSGSVILEAARSGAPRAVLLRMLGNVGVDALLGAVPLLGDLFDVGWKANRRNLDLLEAHLSNPERARRGSVRALVAAGAGVAAVVLVVVAMGSWGIATVVRLLLGG